jgi:DNA-binding response OmpR family regulator
MAKQLLIVDDEAPTRELVGMFFRRKGFEVHTATSGQTALEFLDAHTPDVLILDVGLEDCDGIDLLPRIKQKHPNLPVIVFTGFKTDDDMKRRAMENGAHALMSKTQPLDAMLAEIKQILPD